jgi:hypothetical protein
MSEEKEYEIQIEGFAYITDKSPEGAVKWVKENYMDEVEWLFNVYHQGQEIKLKKENA